MKTRLDFHNLLISILGSSNAYFQPPESVKMTYPCIVYERFGYDTNQADNEEYHALTKYRVTYIDKYPESDVIDNLRKLRYSRWVNHSIIDGLNQDSFEIYY